MWSAGATATATAMFAPRVDLPEEVCHRFVRCLRAKDCAGFWKLMTKYGLREDNCLHFRGQYDSIDSKWVSSHYGSHVGWGTTSSPAASILQMTRDLGATLVWPYRKSFLPSICRREYARALHASPSHYRDAAPGSLSSVEEALQEFFVIYPGSLRLAGGLMLRYYTPLDKGTDEVLSRVRAQLSPLLYLLPTCHTKEDSHHQKEVW